MAAATTEIRWHGRGGQGAKTAAIFLAEAVLDQGKHSQGFPEYGPERRGAPVRGFTRISDAPIRLPTAFGDRVVFASDGGEPSLTAVGGQLRGYARTGRTAEAAATSADVSTAEGAQAAVALAVERFGCLLYTSPSPRDRTRSRMPSSA